MDIDIIREHFPSLTPKQVEQYRLMGDLYRDWNAKINVVSRRDIDNLYERHVLHSLAIAKFLKPVEGTTFLDMGTGGGFPGIPLAVMFPQCPFHLLDRIGKKIRVASEVVAALGLTNVTTQQGDIGECHGRYEFVVSRAVMALGELVPLVRKNIAREPRRNAIPNGLICLKGGDLQAEVRASPRGGKDIMVEGISAYFPEPFFATKQLVYVPMA